MAASDLIGAMRITLGLDSAQFTTGLSASERQAQQSSKKIASSFNVAAGGAKLLADTIATIGGAVSIGALAAVASKALDYASSLAETAQQLGVTSDALQVFRYAGSQVGISTEEMDKGLAKLTLTLGKARDGFKDAQAPFNELSKILGKDILKNATDAGDAIPMIADALAKIPDPAQRAALEVALFGRAGQKLDNLLSGGAAGIEEFTERCRELGLVLSSDQIQRADDAADKISEVKQVLEASIASAVADNAKAIYDFANSIEELIVKIPGAIRQIKLFFDQLRVNSAKITVPFIRNNPYYSDGLKAWAVVEGARARRDLQADKLNDAYAKATPQRRAAWRQRASQEALDALGITREGRLAGVSGKKTATRSIDLGGAGAAASSKAASDAEKKRKEAEREAEKAAERDRRYNRDLDRANDDYLNARLDLTVEQVERNKIERDLLASEHKGRLDQISTDKDLTDAQKRRLSGVEDDTYQLRLTAQTRREEQQAAQNALVHARAQDDNEEDILRARADLAKSSKERRDIEIQLLDLHFKELRREQDAILASDADADTKNDARARLRALGTLQSLGRSSIEQQYAGPLDRYLNDIPKAGDEMRDALQSSVVDGANAAIDSIVGLQQQFLKLPGIVGNVVNAVLADLEKLALQQALKSLFQLIGIGGGGNTSLFNSAASGSGGFSFDDLISGARAGGGPVIGGRTYLVGERGPELFTAPGSGHIVANDDLSPFARGEGLTVLVEANDYFDAKVAGTSADVSSRVVGENNRVQSRAASRRLR